VLELRARAIGVVTCVADAAAIEALGAMPGAFACRVAPDEAMLLTEAGGAPALAADAGEQAVAADPGAIVVDATDGWAAWTLQGDGVDTAFGRLSAVPLAPGFSQGDVAHVPVKILSSDGMLDLLVPAMWGAYLRERILSRCADLGIAEQTEPAAWSPPEGDPA